MSTRDPPSPDGHPLINHTFKFAQDPLTVVRNGIQNNDDVIKLNILGMGDAYFVGHPDIFHRILIDDPDTFSKGADYKNPFGEGIAATDGEKWRKQREAMQDFFAPSQTREYADDMVDTALRHATWDDAETTDLHNDFRKMALETLFKTIFDWELDTLGEDQDILHSADNLNKVFTPLSLALPDWVPVRSRRQFATAKKHLRRTGREIVNQEKQNPTPDENGILSELLRQRKSGEIDMSDDEILDHFITLIFAGQDTTTLTLTYTAYNLGRHPDVEDRVHAELDDVLGGRPPVEDDLENLTVIKRVIRETMRTHPPAHVMPRQPVTDVTLDGYHIPEQSRLYMSIYSAHHDSRFWESPDTWNPRRWTDTSPQEKGLAYIPFGAGRRSCLGRTFALQEATLMLATLCQQYRFKPHRPLTLSPQITIQPKNGVPVTVHER